MKKENPVQEKSYTFALNIVKFCKLLQEKEREFVLSKQLLKAGTSIGANIEEALQAESKKDFAHKLSIALKEAFESRYWLRLVGDSLVSRKENTEQLIQEVNELISLLTSIIKTTRQSLH